MSIIKSVDMELARIVEADYVTVPVDDASLDAATANIQKRTAARGDAAATGNADARSGQEV